MRLGGEDLGPVAPHRRPWLGLGYAPEDRRLFSAFTVEENILLPGRVAKLNPDETRRRLERAYSVLPELKELAKRPAGSVSGGQGKMVALGRALMLGTRLLILDEPFQGLAPVLAQRYAEALRRLRSQDKDITLLITESNPKAARDICGRDAYDRTRRDNAAVSPIAAANDVAPNCFTQASNACDCDHLLGLQTHARYLHELRSGSRNIGGDPSCRFLVLFSLLPSSSLASARFPARARRRQAAWIF